LQGFEGQIDVIVDDGLHSMTPVTETFKNLWPLLSPTGVYLLEDIRQEVDLHYAAWRFPFHTIDEHNFDAATFNHLQVPIPPFQKPMCVQKHFAQHPAALRRQLWD
jgi:hypothetical protein